MQILTLALWLCLCVSALAEDDYPTGVLIYDFAWTERFDSAAITELQPTGESSLFVDSAGTAHLQPRFKTAHLSGKLEWNSEEPTNMVRKLQEPMLKSLLARGAISRKVFDDVMETIGHWEPSQIRYAISFSDLTLAQAKKVFNGKIPWERVMGTSLELDPPILMGGDYAANEEWDINRFREWEYRWRPEKTLRIIRSSVMLGMGQVIDQQTGEYHPWTMAWQRAPENSAIPSLDRSTFRLVAEISRAYAESGTLPGDFTLPLKMLFFRLQREAALSGIPEEKVGLFAWARDAIRSRHFVRKFGMRLWNEESANWFREQPDAGQTYQSILPQKNLPENSVLMIRLPEALKTIPTVGISKDVARFQSAVKYQLSENQVLDAVDTLRSGFLEFFHFPEFPEQKGAVTVSHTSVLAQAQAVKAIEGLPLSDESANAFLHHFGRDNRGGIHPFHAGWSVYGIATVPRDDEDKFFNHNERHTCYSSIDNLSIAAAQAHPLTYLATVLFRVDAARERKIRAASEVGEHNFHLTLRQVNLPEDPHLDYRIDPAPVTRYFPWYLTTHHAELANQMRELGGESRPAFRVDTETILSSGAKTTPTYLFRFPAEVVDQLKRRFPALARQANARGCSEGLQRLHLASLATQL